MGMETMFADMLKKAIPPEVLALMSEENIRNFGDQAKTFVAELREGIARIEATQMTILEKLEGIENAGRDSVGDSARKRNRSGGGNDKP